MTANSDNGRLELTVLRYMLLLAPVLLAVALIFSIQKFKEPLRNEYPSGRVIEQTADAAARATAERETRNRDRITIAVLLELFVLTLMVRPWEFPWRARRWGIAGAVLFVWSGLILASAQHGGRLIAWHALALMGLALTVFPLVTTLLLVRYGWRRCGKRPGEGR